MVVIRTLVHFESAHRQYGDTSKCGYLHGHNWKADIEIDSNRVNGIGYVVDFKNIKDAIRDRFDHKVVLNMNDPLADMLIGEAQHVEVIHGNPTCEVLAKIIKEQIYEMLSASVSYDKITVTLWENGDCYARA